MTSYTPRGVLALDPANWPELDDADIPPPRDLGLTALSWDRVTADEE